MFENILYQPVISQISHDIINNTFPQSVLFSGVENCAKLTVALEIARVLSCKKDSNWDCDCPQCQSNRKLTNPNLLLLGNKSLIPEIKATSEAFVNSFNGLAKQKTATKLLFIRSVRKLTARFNPALYSDSKDLAKISAISADIEEQLRFVELFDGVDTNDADKAATKLPELCSDLIKYLPYSIPIDHIRGAETFARLKSDFYKFIIIEACQSMTDGARNALLKILEEPPPRCIFILTTDKKNMLLPTVLSRLRIYNFSQRTIDQDSEICDRVFRRDFTGSLTQFFMRYSSIDIEVIKNTAKEFLRATDGGQFSFDTQLKNCGGFSDSQTLKIFFNELLLLVSPLLLGTTKDLFRAQNIFSAIQNANLNVFIYNESPRAALESLLQIIRGL